MRVFKAACEKIALSGPLEGYELREPSTRRGILGRAIPCPPRLPLRAINQQVHLTREARERRHCQTAVPVFNDELGDENGVVNLGKGIIKPLAGVHAAQHV